MAVTLVSINVLDTNTRINSVLCFESKSFPDGSALGFPIHLSFGEVRTAIFGSSGRGKTQNFGPDDHRDETGEIPLWLCEDSRFQEFFYFHESFHEADFQSAN